MAAGLIASTFAGCAKVDYVTQGAIKAIHEIKDGSWQKTEENPGAAKEGDPVVLKEEFKAGKYGNVEFKTVDDLVNYYVECYNYTKSLTADYINPDGNKEKYYKLIGTEDLKVGDVYIDGKANAVINKLVPTIVSGIFQPNAYGLPPCNNKNPDWDNTGDESDPKLDFRTSYLKPEHILAANAKDNGDGTITLEIQPKAGEMSMRGEDSQGSFFEVLGDIAGVVGNIKQLSFTEGGAKENVKVSYKGGVGTVKIDTKTKEITEATYHMVVSVSVTHANVAVIKNKSANLQIDYTNTYPATDEQLAKVKISRAK